ncbi:class II glutamine amidotransferase [Hydrogenophaga sp.]|uniref:class II glutamine amidotransferase n=1 Tax=Hydrogenophaga sp. TaxID=1904254 RepID=UPI0025C3F5E4|nr:class II glutamine amidotransferase [Hydrogenophaga sp.]
MCQLLGLNCATPTDASFSFTGFCQRGGGTDHHADGWGIAFFEGKGMRLFVDHQSAAASPIAQFLQQYPLKSRNIIAHVRKATIGEVTLENAHPFTRSLWGRHWVFAHNGDLKNYEPQLHGRFQPVGTTDSERAFCWLMQELTQSHASLPSIEELTLTLRELVPKVAAFGSFNFLLSNGDAMWAHCSTKLHYLIRQHPFSQATLMDRDWTVNFAELNQPGDRAAVIVTTPLTSNEAWTAFAPGELRVFVDGLHVA